MYSSLLSGCPCSLFILASRKLTNKTIKIIKKHILLESFQHQLSHCINIFSFFWLFKCFNHCFGVSLCCLFSFVLCIDPVSDDYTCIPVFSSFTKSTPNLFRGYIHTNIWMHMNMFLPDYEPFYYSHFWLTISHDLNSYPLSGKNVAN